MNEVRECADNAGESPERLAPLADTDERRDDASAAGQGGSKILASSQAPTCEHAEQSAIAMGVAMDLYDHTPVDDGTYAVRVKVYTGDDLIELTASDGVLTPVEARMTIRETLALIASLTEAITVAINNKEE